MCAACSCAGAPAKAESGEHGWYCCPMQHQVLQHYSHSAQLAKQKAHAGLLNHVNITGAMLHTKTPSHD